MPYFHATTQTFEICQHLTVAPRAAICASAVAARHFLKLCSTYAPQV